MIEEIKRALENPEVEMLKTRFTHTVSDEDTYNCALEIADKLDIRFDDSRFDGIYDSSLDITFDDDLDTAIAKCIFAVKKHEYLKKIIRSISDEDLF